MKRFTNVNVKKEYKRMIRSVLISILFIIIAFGFKYLESQMVKDANKKMTDLDSVIVSKENKKDNKKVYLDVKSIPYLFAVSNSTVNSYYIVSDGEFLYVAFMSPDDFKTLNTDDIKDKSIRIEGITKYTPKDVKQLAIDAYNEGLDDDKKITIADYDSYFGAVYLDMTAIDESVAMVPLVLFIIFMGIGNILFIVSLIVLIRFTLSVKNLDGTKIDELDNEMNNSNAFYYSKVRLYLTENYIINFKGTFRAIKYSDILWMYPYEVRQNGVRTSKSIKILVNNTKTYIIATIDVYTKKSKAVYDEIWETIVRKNPDMLLGYTSENIKAMNKKVKEIKKSNKK